jgi:pimeloyl-ACP methyl ester carboxylesterase
MFNFLVEQAASHASLKLHCSYGPVHFGLQSDDALTYVLVDEAGAQLSETPLMPDLDFTLAASSHGWAELRKPEPRPGFQTLSAMRRTRNLMVTGDMTKFFQHMMLLELLFSNLSGDGILPAQPVEAPEIEPVIGRYLRLNLGGKPHRLYFEEAGSGIPRHILNDPEITGRFRVIAFDLPWHGKSSPPAGFESDVYKLTTDGYVGVVMAVAAALKLEQPVVMGCSIGGRAVLHLALQHGERFRAAIGLQSALFAEDVSLGDLQPERALHRPDMHGGMLAGASMAGMIAPQSPPAERWETMWHYMQGGPGIFLGGIHYYFKDGDLRNGLADALKDSPCPLYLLSGEYDPSATPEMGREVAKLANAAHFEVMEGMGHFPMSENPELFRRYLLPVLEKILAA